MDAFGIFEGGGAKGVAHIGALKAAELHHVKFIGVAGTSAGAIVAALLATGYRADDLYSPDPAPTGLFAKDFVRFLDQVQWQKYKAIRDDAKQTYKKCRVAGAISTWRHASFFMCRNSAVLSELRDNRGFFNTEKFRRWLELLLLWKLRQRNEDFKASAANGCVAFCDLLIPLKIISADISSRRVKAYSLDKTPEQSVSHAVAASISIPGVFRPKLVDSDCLVDGGIVSNFPAWVFDSERKAAPQLTPSFGFKLASSLPHEGTDDLPGFLKALFETSVFGDTSLETREVESLHEIPLRVRIGPLDFEINEQQKCDVYRDGKDSARDFFASYVGPSDPDLVRRHLRTVHSHMLKTLDHHHGHLRVNVMRPVGNDRLQVIYSHKMDTDCDDRLSLRLGTGACGVCWEKQTPVICDLQDAKATFDSKWKMDKYQQCLVRQSLKSLLCVPVFDPDTLSNDGRPTEGTKIVAVLNFDSDDDISEKFGSEDVLKVAADCASLIFKLLKS